MITISATEFKAKCLHLLDEVQRTGQGLVISKHGKPVARVVAEPVSQPWLALRGKGRFKGDAFEPAVKESAIDALR
jgi:prevent-host-death family protein